MIVWKQLKSYHSCASIMILIKSVCHQPMKLESIEILIQLSEPLALAVSRRAFRPEGCQFNKESRWKIMTWMNWSRYQLVPYVVKKWGAPTQLRTKEKIFYSPQIALISLGDALWTRNYQQQWLITLNLAKNSIRYQFWLVRLDWYHRMALTTVSISNPTS
jgi:hypothetical protein